jgi:hypothetical protein
MKWMRIECGTKEEESQSNKRSDLKGERNNAFVTLDVTCAALNTEIPWQLWHYISNNAETKCSTFQRP